MDKKHLSQVLFLIITIAVISSGCSVVGTDLQKKYGDDSFYYIALDSLNNNDQDNAERLLKKGAKSGTPLIARRCAEKLATLGSVQDRIKRYLELYKTYPDEDAQLLAVKELDNDEEYAQVITLTSNIDVTTCDNELAYCHCHALYEKKDIRFTAQFTLWCTSRPFTAAHYKLYTKVSDPLPAEIIFRAVVYKQSYQEAYDSVRSICTGSDKAHPTTSSLSAQIVSDAGKACLYGSTEYLHDAYYFDSLAQKVPDETKFNVYFYAGRLYDRADEHNAAAAERFIKAMSAAKSDQSYDNALWYYFNTELKSSISEAITAIQKYRTSWHDPYYFDDYFDTLSVRLLSQHLWSDFYSVAKLLDGYASNEIVAKYSYIAGRLIETGFVKASNQSQTEAATALFNRALSSGTDLYYRLVAANRLQLSNDDMVKVIYSPTHSDSFKRNLEVEKLLEGYADFGFAENIYTEWQHNSDSVGIDSVKKIAGFLQQCGGDKNDFYAKSLRIASNKIINCEVTPDEDMLKLVYPQDFHDAVADTCKRFDMPEYLLYALIRSESFFDPQIVSHVGATGLTQLMGSTAADISRKLKKEDYDLNDSATNIMFGGYYLEEMRRRLDGSSILALFAYNGGISRVRTWVKSANLEFATNTLPKDLFLEALPFAETREYGRKVVSAAAMYGYLYYGKTTSEVIEEILQ